MAVSDITSSRAIEPVLFVIANRTDWTLRQEYVISLNSQKGFL